MLVRAFVTSLRACYAPILILPSRSQATVTQQEGGELRVRDQRPSAH